jgi:hypothetical protein
LVLHFSGAFPSDYIPKVTKDVDLPRVLIPVSYTSEFRELFESITYFIVRA